MSPQQMTPACFSATVIVDGVFQQGIVPANSMPSQDDVPGVV
jgi:hypothetical protein